MKYILTKNAELDLIQIYQFGMRRFGITQADFYFDCIQACFIRIAKGPRTFPKVDELGVGLRRCVCKSESIYFKIKEDYVLIIAIIGQQNFGQSDITED